MRPPDLVFAPTLACERVFRFFTGLTSKPRHAHESTFAYVDPFARGWPGFSTTGTGTPFARSYLTK